MQEYNKTDQQIHQLSQIITKANRTFVPKKDDDSHTNLYFDPHNHRIYGRWIKASAGNFILTLNLNSFEFEWINDDYKIVQSHTVSSKKDFEIENNIANNLDKIGLDRNGFVDDLHYKIPEYSFKNEPFLKLNSNALKLWESYRRLANQTCFALIELMQISAEIRIWPHHFDTGIYFEPNKKLGLGFGLAMEDNLIGRPYFYYSAYGLNGYTFDYQSFDALSVGQWITNDNWKGAVLSLSSLKADDFNMINLFIKEVTESYLSNESIF